MNHPNWTVQDHDIRTARPGRCFYCHEPKGGRHKPGCIPVPRRVSLLEPLAFILWRDSTKTNPLYPPTFDQWLAESEEMRAHWLKVADATPSGAIDRMMRDMHKLEQIMFDPTERTVFDELPEPALTRLNFLAQAAYVASGIMDARSEVSALRYEVMSQQKRIGEMEAESLQRYSSAQQMDLLAPA